MLDVVLLKPYRQQAALSCPCSVLHAHKPHMHADTSYCMAFPLHNYMLCLLQPVRRAVIADAAPHMRLPHSQAVLQVRSAFPIVHASRHAAAGAGRLQPQACLTTAMFLGGDMKFSTWLRGGRHHILLGKDASPVGIPATKAPHNSTRLHAPATTPSVPLSCEHDFSVLLYRCTASVLPLYRSFMMEYDIHTVLDALTLVATAMIVYCMIGTDIKQTYQKDQDRVKWYFVVGCVLCELQMGTVC